MTQLQAIDFQLIKKVAARFNHAISSGSSEQLAACFIPDGSWEVSNAWHEVLAGSHQGHAELCRVAEAFFSIVGRGGIRVWTNSPLIEGGGDQATFQAYLMAYVPKGDGVSFIGTAMVKDRLRKVKGEWLLEKRHLEVEHYPQDEEWVAKARAAFVFCGTLTPVPGLLEISDINADTALDTELIMQTQAKYNLYWDYMEEEKWPSCFEDDGVFEVVGGDHLYKSVSWHAAKLPTSHQGTEQLRAFVRNARVGRTYPRDRHWQGAAWIAVQGNDAMACVPCVSQSAGTLEQLNSLTTILYFDNLRKTNGEWRFVKRRAMPEFHSEQLAKARAEVAGRYVV